MSMFNINRPQNIEQLKIELDKINSLSAKEKYIKLKALSFMLDITEELTLNEIALYTQIIRSAKKAAGFPEKLDKKLQLLEKIRLMQLGVDFSNIKNILNINFNVKLFSATVGIGDEQFIDEYHQEDISKQEEELISQGKRLFFSTGYDGIVKIQVRVVQLEYPVFSEKEYKKFLCFSDTFLLAVPTGGLIITDYISNTAQKKIEIQPGQYRVCFSLDNKRNFVVCLAKVNSPINIINNQPIIPKLE